MSLVGTTWMGEFAKLGGLEPTPDSFDSGAVLRGGVGHDRGRRRQLRRAVVRRDPRSSTTAPTSPRRAASTRRRPTGTSSSSWPRPRSTPAPSTASACSPAAPVRGRRSCRSSGRPAARSSTRRALHARLGGLRRGADVLRLVLRGGSGAAGGRRTCRSRAQFADGDGRLVHQRSVDDRRRHRRRRRPGDVDRRPPAEEETATSFVGGGNLAVFEQSDNKAGGVGVRRVPDAPRGAGQVVRDGEDLPAVQAAWDDATLADDEHAGRPSASSSRTPSHRRPSRRGRRSPRRSTTRSSRSRVGDASPEDGCAGDAAGGRVDRHRAVTATVVGAPAARSAEPSRQARRRTGSRRSSAGASPCRSCCCSSSSWPGRSWSSFIISFTDLRVTDIRSPFGVNFVGLDNYVDVFGDPTFRKAAGNTAIYVLVAVPLTMGLGLLIALALNQGVVKLRRLFRVGFFLPVRDEHRRHRRRLADPARAPRTA